MIAQTDGPLVIRHAAQSVTSEASKSRPLQTVWVPLDQRSGRQHETLYLDCVGVICTAPLAQ